MTSKKLFVFLLFLFANISFGQQKRNPKIINKDIKINSASDIIDIPSNASFTSELAIKNYNKKTLVYCNGKFFSLDTLRKINPKDIASLEVIKIPDSITKDIKAIIYLKKVIK